MLLDSWKQAFPAARGVALRAATHAAADLVTEAEADTVVWLRLSADATVAQQLAIVRSLFTTQALVALSDMPNDLEALAVLSVGARAYCNTHAGAEVLLNVAGVVAQGGLWIGESIMYSLLSRPSSPAPALRGVDAVAGYSQNLNNRSWANHLTEREHEVANAVAAGLNNREIAAQLGVTERTVKAHVGALLEKLELRDRLQLALLIKG